MQSIQAISKPSLDELSISSSDVNPGAESVASSSRPHTSGSGINRPYTTSSHGRGERSQVHEQRGHGVALVVDLERLNA